MTGHAQCALHEIIYYKSPYKAENEENKNVQTKMCR